MAPRDGTYGYQKAPNGFTPGSRKEKSHVTSSGWSTDAFDDDIAQEMAFNELRASGPLSTAYDTIEARPRAPLPVGRLIVLFQLWLLLLAAGAAWVYLLADEELRFLSDTCPVVIVHYIVVGALLVAGGAGLGLLSCRWSQVAASRNDHLKPNRAADSSISGIGNASLQQDSRLGSHWETYLDRQADTRARSWSGQCGRSCRAALPCALLALVLLGLAFNFAVAVSWHWLLQSTEQSVLAGPIDFQVKGLSATVTLEWQKTGMVHIRADNEMDLFFAQGFVSSQLRLWQMEMQRRQAFGRLAEVVGEAALPADKLFRTLGLAAAAQATVAALDVPARQALEAYTAGVNAYLDLRRPLPLEFQLLGAAQPEPWTTADSVAMAKLMAFELSGNLEMELRRYALLQRGVAPTRVAQLLPPYDMECPDTNNGSCTSRGGYFPTVLQPHDCPRCGGSCCPPWSDPPASGAPWPARPAPGRSARKAAELAEAVAAELRDQPQWQNASAWPRGGLLAGFGGLLGRQGSTAPGRTAPAGRPHLGASNNWAVDGRFTASGAPLLANDPHLELSAPGIWLLIDLECPTYKAGGAALAGTPFVIIGKSPAIGWGVTNTGVDVQDLYVLTETNAAGGKLAAGRTGLSLVPRAATHYMLDGKPEAFGRRVETVKVKGRADVVLAVRSTVFGPVVTDALDTDELGGLRSYPFHGRDPLALHWVSIDPGVNDTTLGAFYKLGSANNWTDFRAGLSLLVAPSQNFVFADATTNAVGYQMPGRVPTRVAGHTGLHPVPGNVSDYRWTGFVPYEQLPRTDEGGPAAGFVVSANNQVAPVNYAAVLSGDWDAGSSGYRAKRIATALTDHIERGAKFTVETMAALQLDTHSSLADDLWPTLSGLQAALFTPAGSRAQERLLAWDRDMRIGSSSATLFAMWTVELSKLAATETGETHWSNWAFLRAALATGDRACGGDGCGNFAANALNVAAGIFEARSEPEWGEDVHRATFKHPVLDTVPVLSCLGDRAAAHGGDISSVNVGPFDPADPDLEQTAGPSYRQLLDMDDGGRSTAVDPGSRFVGPIGQSGNPLSRHYADTLPIWAAGDYWYMARLGYPNLVTQTLEPTKPGGGEQF
jgi:penicillin amidase